MFISEEVGFEKPHPKIYLRAIDQFNVRPEETLFVGDNWKNDVIGPTEVGMKAIWLNINNKPVPDYKKAYGIINRLVDLKQFVR